MCTLRFGITNLAKADAVGCERALRASISQLELDLANCRLGIGDGNATVGATFRKLEKPYLLHVPHFADNEIKSALHFSILVGCIIWIRKQ